ncbi:hypothetical protein LTR17_025104 [Elasticomyces elasticus]|nr:hypothetical protein LTR17_025104 [Elasticomyces elasticus]
MARRRRRAKGGHGPAPAEPVSIMPTSQEPAHQQTEQTCHFMRLPAELRNAIYELFLVERLPVDISHNVSFEEPSWFVRRTKLPAITRTNSQIREETLAIFLGANTFQVSHDEDRKFDPRPNLPDAHSWLRCLTLEQRRLIKEIVFCIRLGLERLVNDDRFSFDVLKRFPRSEEAWKLRGGPRLYLTDQEVGEEIRRAGRNYWDYHHYYRIVLEERLASKRTTASSHNEREHFGLVEQSAQKTSSSSGAQLILIGTQQRVCEAQTSFGAYTA